MLFFLLSRLVAASSAFIYPAYASYKAIKSNDLHSLEVWLMYWVVMGVVMTIESTVEWTFAWFPFYYEFKTLVILWLTLPQIQGSTYIYVAHIEPFLSSHEGEIDRAVADAKVKAKAAGLNWINNLILRVREMVVGTIAPQLFAAGGEGTANAQPIPHPLPTGDTASNAASGLYALGGNVLRQYGPAAVALGSALLNPNASIKKTSRGAVLTKATPEEDSTGHSTSTVTTPANYSVPPRANRSVSAGNPSSVGVGQPPQPTGPVASNSMFETVTQSDRFEKIGKHELGGMDAPVTPGGSKWWWSKDSELSSDKKDN